MFKKVENPQFLKNQICFKLSFLWNCMEHGSKSASCDAHYYTCITSTTTTGYVPVKAATTTTGYVPVKAATKKSGFYWQNKEKLENLDNTKYFWIFLIFSSHFRHFFWTFTLFPPLSPPFPEIGWETGGNNNVDFFELRKITSLKTNNYEILKPGLWSQVQYPSVCS